MEHPTLLVLRLFGLPARPQVPARSWLHGSWTLGAGCHCTVWSIAWGARGCPHVEQLPRKAQGSVLGLQKNTWKNRCFSCPEEQAFLEGSDATKVMPGDFWSSSEEFSPWCCTAVGEEEGHNFPAFLLVKKKNLHLSMSRHMMQQELLSRVLVYPIISISGHCHSYSRTMLSSVPEFPALDAGPSSLTAILEESSTYPCLLKPLTTHRQQFWGAGHSTLEKLLVGGVAF